MCFASVGSYLRMLNLNYSVPTAIVFTVANYGRLTLAAFLHCVEFTATHCYLLSLICRCLPVFDDILRRSLNFARVCVKHESPLVRSLASHGLTVACNNSFFGRNVLFCAGRYCCTVSDILQRSINNIINSHVQFNAVDDHLETANLLSELLNIKDGRDSSLVNLSSGELHDIRCFICTS